MLTLKVLDRYSRLKITWFICAQSIYLLDYVVGMTYKKQNLNM